MGLIVAAIIVYLVGAAVICAGIAGLYVFVPALVGYVKTREKKFHKRMITGVALAIPLLLSLLSAGVRQLGDAVADHSSIYIQMTSGTAEEMERLLKKGISADCKATNLKNTPAKDNEYTLLTYLSSYNSHYKDCVEKAELLLDYGADVNWAACPNCHASYDHGHPFCKSTPLLLVCSHPGEHSSELVELFIEHGADVNAVSGEGRTGLDILDEKIYLWESDGEQAPDTFKELRKTLVKYGAKNKKRKN